MDLISAAATTTTNANIQSQSDFWLFVVYCLVVIVVVIFFLFYFNRVLGQILTFLINQYTWRKYNAYIEVDSIRVSLLGGRVLFKNLRYLSTNQSISIIKGHFSIQYWLLNVRKSEDDKKGKTSHSPCRIACKVEGLECFIYNNKPAYDRMKSVLGLSPVETNPSTTAGTEQEKLTVETRAALDPESQTPMNGDNHSLLERLMPIQFECTTGAVMIGNTEIKSMIVCKMPQASGIYSISKSRSSMDYYKTVLDVVLRKPQVSLKDNMDFTRVDAERARKPLPRKTMHHLLYRAWDWLLSFIKTRQYGEMQHLQHIIREGHSEARYDDLENPTYHEEYARVNNVLECNEMALTYYADYAGPVPSSEEASDAFPGMTDIDIGNGGLSPEWGCRIYLWDAAIQYGPWADRQRNQMQDYFFPNSHRGNTPTTRLEPGQQRIPTSFETYIEFMNEGKVRVPTREKSKDWKYASGSSDLDIGSDGYYTRPYGWIDLKAGEGSYIKVTTPFVYGSNGCVNKVDMVLKETDITSSVNYSSFVQSHRIEIQIEMPAPLQWNAYRLWNIKITPKKATIFLLRDHIYLLQDVAKDWTSLPPADLLHFTPITYQLQFNLENPTVYLCVNEHNVINNPNSIEDNAFLKVQTHKLTVGVTLPLTEFQPETTAIKFTVNAEHINAGLSLQTSHTLNAFMREDDAHAAVAVNIGIEGSYEAYSTVDIMRHIESCNLYIKINGATVKLFGTLIRYLFLLKDNYFGAWNNFSTIDEYRKRRNNNEEWLAQKKRQLESKPQVDPFEVYVLLDLEDGVLLLPENLYECSRYSQLEFQELQLELRNLDVYMDLYLNISPITMSRDSNPNPQFKQGYLRIKNARDPKNYLYIDGFNVHAHRLFGPLPECATYLCHWDFDVGRITGEIKPSFLLGLACFGQTFAYNLIDEDNAVSKELESKSLPDVTFLKAYIREIDISLMSLNSATNISFKDGVLIEFNNLINVKYSQCITIKIPVFLTRCLANPDQARNNEVLEGDSYSWVEVAKADLGLNITIFRHTASWQKARSEQQNYIRTQDYPTRRCIRLYEDIDTNSQSSRSSFQSGTNEHHVGVIYAPPFRPFMSGRVEDKSVLYDTSSLYTDVPTPRQGRPRGYSNPSSMSSSRHSSSASELIFNESDGDDSDFDLENVCYERFSMHSGLSKDNDSFHTAKDSDNEEETEETAFNSFWLSDNYSIISKEDQGITSDEEANDQRTEIYRKISTKELKSAIPPSIPYSDYLRRYRIERKDTELSFGGFFHPYIPPSQASFYPEKDFEEKSRPLYDQNDYHTEDYFSSTKKHQEDINTEFDTTDAYGEGNEVVATTVIEATRPVTMLVTPILIKLIQELTEEIIKDDWDLETMLDSIQIEYIEQLTRYLTDQYICTRFAVILPQTYLHFIQNVTVPDELPSYLHGESIVKTQYNAKDTVLCSADIFLNDFHMIGSVKFEDYAFAEKKNKVAESNIVLQESRVHIDVGDMGSTVQYISKQHERQSIAFGIPYESLRNKELYHNAVDDDDDALVNELVMLDLAVKGFSFKWLGARKPNFAELTIQEVDTITITESVEILVGAVHSWLVFVDDLKGILESFQEQRLKQVQVFVNEIANFSVTQAVAGDPIFLTAPTTMLRLGSRNFRNDVGWKLLARMRHCLRSMPLSKREELQYRLTSGGALQGINSDAMFKNVVQTFSLWRNWEIGHEDVLHSRLFTQPFKQKMKQEGVVNKNITDEAVKFLTSSSNFAKFRLGQFKFTIYEEEASEFHEEENSICIRSVELLLECLFKSSPISALSADTNTTPDGYRKSEIVEGYLDVITKIGVGSIDISTNPIILAFARHMILVERVFATKLRSYSSDKKQETRFTSPNQDFDFDAMLSRVDMVAQALINVDKIQIVARAQELCMDTIVTEIQGSALFSNPKLAPLQLTSYADRDSDTGSGKRSSNRTPRRNLSSEPRLILEAAGGIQTVDIKFKEESRRNKSQTVLLGVLLEKANVNANVSQIAKATKKLNKINASKEVLNVFSNIHKFHIHAPQSLLRLYGFVESWQAEQGRRYHFMIQNLVKEWEVQRKDVPENSSAFSLASSQPNAASRKSDIKLQFLLNEFLIQADLLPSLSVEYRILDFFLMVNENQQKLAPVRMYSFQLSKQEIHLITKDAKNKSKGDNTGIFSIPGIRSTGSLRNETVDGGEQLKLRSILFVGLISMSLDVGLIDSLLTAQSLVGNEVSELIEVLSYSKQHNNNKNADTVANEQSKSSKVSRVFKYTMDISLDGLRISASSPSAIGMFQSNLLEASISNDSKTNEDIRNASSQLTWKLQAKNFSLSLDHNTVEDVLGHEDTACHRNCLAYILADFSVQNYVSLCTEDGCTKSTHAHHTEQNFEAIFVDFCRIQAVMQPIALGKLAEMYIYYDTELSKKKMMKKEEIDQLSTNTKRIVQSISVKNEWQKASQDETQFILEGKVICLHVRRLGIAIPLDERSDVPISESCRDGSALLLSISSIEFLSKSIEKGALQLDNITMQFVKRFDQNKAEHFIAENHPRMNLINFPCISCNVSATNIKPIQRVKMDAKVMGFEVDVDGTIADYINVLSIIYVKSMDRVDSFTAKSNLNSKNSKSSTSLTSLASSSSNRSEVVHLDVESQFECDSGVIRMYPKRHSNEVQKTKKQHFNSLRIRTGFETKPGESNVATLDLPGLNAWMTYQTPLGAHATVAEAPKRFHADILIRESCNTLQPAFVQFLHEVVTGLKLGIQQSSERKADRDAVAETESNLNASLLLRLSKTQLDLSCQPVSKVICSLGWEESEFLLNAFSKDTTSRTMSCVGSVRETTAVVKHHFSPEACLNARIDRILFNAMLTSQREGGHLNDDISVIVDFPNISGDLNMRHLQDLLVLYKCWFAQAISAETSDESRAQSNMEKQGPSSQLIDQTTAVDRQVHAISSPKSPAPFSKHVAIRLQNMKFSVDLGQNIGRITLRPENLSFQAHATPQESKGLSLILEAIHVLSEGRLSGSAEFKRMAVMGRIDQSSSQEMSSIYVILEGFMAKFEYEYQNILDVIQQSLELNIDLEKVAGKYSLHISANLDALIARISIKTVPVIITMIQKFDELLQKKKVEAGMKSISIPNVHETSFDVGHVNNKALYEKSAINSQTSICIQAVEFVIYPSQFQDSDNVDIRAREFKIDLKEFPRTAEGVHRKLIITLASASLAKNVPGKDLMIRYSAPLPPAATKPKNLGGTKIFGIPGTQVSMDSTQLDRNIAYEFDAVFAGRIGVSLNIGLIKYLQEMINMFSLQLDRVRDKNNDKLPIPAELNTPNSSNNADDNEDNILSVPETSRRKSSFALSVSSKSEYSTPTIETMPSTVENATQADTENEQVEKYVYTSVNTVNFQPQLQVMGDATPPVEWLGLKRERIPGLVHENIALHLDKVIKMIWEVLESQTD
ncbi:uncharacterized protein B0P05DRAFT_589949 [Gilbertella persicaria]|uniref:uncharacterized protein n=1 Tax=Gilbertella persicaria TaxID=101096 RepID=UPI00221FDDD6|nr:uncharacterized protein B0P05DRAFT_589949 [Gilbertella persicaria]KAI8065374.1 hypothetical protein B0P05DRAFT_589949 [Gilbertella persicaria]